MANIFNSPITGNIQSSRRRAAPLPSPQSNIGNIFGGLDLQSLLQQPQGQPQQQQPQGNANPRASGDIFSGVQPGSLGLGSPASNQAASSQPSDFSLPGVSFGLGDAAKVGLGFATGNVGGALKGIAQDKTQQGITANVQSRVGPEAATAIQAGITGFKAAGVPGAAINAIASMFGLDAGSLAGLAGEFGTQALDDLARTMFGANNTLSNSITASGRKSFADNSNDGGDEGGFGMGAGEAGMSDSSQGVGADEGQVA